VSAVAPKAKIKVALSADLRADAAAVAVLRALLEVILGNRDGALTGEDPEYLHQFRIAVRRSRTVQRQLAGVFPPLELRGFRAEFRWLQRATGEARDLDVHVLDFEPLRMLLPEPLRPGLDPLRQILEHWRLAAHGLTARALRSRRTGDLLSDWEMLLETLVELSTIEREASRQPIGELSARRTRHVYRQVLRMGEVIAPTSPPEVLHELRKKGKELRYLLELFGVPLHSADVLDPLISPLKRVQDVLGRHHDRQVQTDLLHHVAPEVATLPGGAGAVLAMGILVERLASDADLAREELAAPLAELGAPEQRELVKVTFPNTLPHP
jgi:CHAD domain-containing protein